MTKAERNWRTRYSKASSRLRSQIRALEKRYPESVALERGGLEDWGGLKTLPKDYSLKDLKRLTQYAEKTLKSGLYSLQRHRRAYANAAMTLKEEGINVSYKNTGAYFRFLDEIRERGLASILYNKAPALIREAKKRGLSSEDLRKNIDRWAQEYERAQEAGKAEKFRPKIGSSASFADKS